MSEMAESRVDSLLARLGVGDIAASRELLELAENLRTSRAVADEIFDGLAAIELQRRDGMAAELLVAALFDQPFLRAETHRVLLRQVEVDESLQETMLAIIGALPSFNGDSSIRTWARAIARNTAIGQLRRRRERVGVDADVASSMGEVQRFSSMLATRHDVSSAMSQLPPDFEAVVRLRDIEHLSYEQIAERLGIKLNTVRSRLARGRARLAAQLEPS